MSTRRSHAESARHRLASVIVDLELARDEVTAVVGATHDAASSITKLVLEARVAAAKLDLLIRRLPIDEAP